jgi:hypothetical protein
MRHKTSVVFTAVMLAATVAVTAAGCAGEEVTAQTAAAVVPAGSSGVSATETSTTLTAAGTDDQATAVATGALRVEYDSEDEDASWDPSAATKILLAGTSIQVDGTGATATGSTVTINAAGTYIVSGTLDDGQVVVASETEGTVKLVLNGADIACSTSAPLFITAADKTVITLAEGTENRVTDGDPYVLADTDAEEPNAAILSKDDLTINGSGSLMVTANHNDGIAGKDDLKIVSGTLTVDAANDAIQGKDCVGVKNGTLTLTAGGDGLRATEDADAEKGYVAIEGGTFTIVAGGDGIQAQTTLAVSGGDFAISTGGGSANSSQAMGNAGNTWGGWDRSKGPAATTDASATDRAATGASTDSPSAKGLKAAGGVFVTGGTFTIDSSDDAIHSNGTVCIGGGTIDITSGDDGIHADANLEIDGGEIDIARSYEGLESTVVTIDGGTIRVVSSDDAINVAGGADGSSVDGRAGQNDFTANANNRLSINGGYIMIDAGGDGIDSNGSIFMTEGVVIVNGPTNDGNGAVDYLGEFSVSGGYVVAVGSAGMAQAPGETSTQRSIMVNFDQAQQAGTLVRIESEDGDDVLTFTPSKQYQSVVVCSPTVEEGETYTVYLGGSSSGTATDGLYSGGIYTPGTTNVSLSVTGVVTVSGAVQGMRGAGGTPPGRR